MKNSPRQTNCASPRRNTFPSQRTVCTPPGAITSTGDVQRPEAMAATAEAQEPVPEDWVSPTPRSKKRTSALCLFVMRSEEHTSELQSRVDLVCRLLLEK